MTGLHASIVIVVAVIDLEYRTGYELYMTARRIGERSGNGRALMTVTFSVSAEQ